MQRLFKVNSSNFTDALLTKAAYDQAVAEMSTGDFHTHTMEVMDDSELAYLDPSEPVFDLITDSDIDSVCTLGELMSIYKVKVKAKKAKQKRPLAPVININRAKPKDKTPRERLLKNQRELFGYIAPVINLKQRA